MHSNSRLPNSKKSCCSFPGRRYASIVLLAPWTIPASGLAIVRPDHVVVVIEEDRACNAIGDVVHMPYFNQLAGTGLVYNHYTALNTPPQTGEMDYLGLYSGSTQGVTDNGRNYSFSGPNLGKSLNSVAGMSFVGYCESLPSDGSQVPQAADPISDPANHPDLYTRCYNPMAMFTDEGPGKVNADVNKTFAHFPTNFSLLPTVSIVVPNNLHNTHGSNEAPPFATDPSAYNPLRIAADTWLQQHMDGYVQWAQTHNSLLIVIGDELDVAHPGNGSMTTILTGDPNLFVAGTDTTAVGHYSLLRTLEDMYGLSPLGNSAGTSAFHSNGAGILSAPAIISAWSGGAAGTSSWGATGNWSGGVVPDGQDVTANFGPAAASQHMVTVDQARTAGVLSFNDSIKYTLNGATITIETTGGGGSITVATGSHDINSALVLAKNTTFTVTNSGSTLKASDLRTTSVAITKAGAGALSVNTIRAGSLAVNAGAAIVLPGRSTAATSRVTSLSIAGGTAPSAALDLGDNDLVIDYPTGGTSPISTIAAQILAGYAGGTWNGNGIRSSIAASQSSSGHRTALGFAPAASYAGFASGAFSGQSIDATCVLVRYTYAGDANLDGIVDTIDFNLLTANFSTASGDWWQADFDYSGMVDTVDFNLLSSNFARAIAAPAGNAPSVPEPATLMALSVLAYQSLSWRGRYRRSI